MPLRQLLQAGKHERGLWESQHSQAGVVGEICGCVEEFPKVLAGENYVNLFSHHSISYLKSHLNLTSSN